MRFFALFALACVEPNVGCETDPEQAICFGELSVDLDGPVPTFRVVSSFHRPNRIEVSHLDLCEGNTGANTNVWRVRELGDALRQEGLAYGAAPEGSAVQVPPAPLVREDTYLLEIGGQTPPPYGTWSAWFRLDPPEIEPGVDCPSW